MVFGVGNMVPFVLAFALSVGIRCSLIQPQIIACCNGYIGKTGVQAGWCVHVNDADKLVTLVKTISYP